MRREERTDLHDAAISIILVRRYHRSFLHQHSRQICAVAVKGFISVRTLSMTKSATPPPLSAHEVICFEIGTVTLLLLSSDRIWMDDGRLKKKLLILYPRINIDSLKGSITNTNSCAPFGRHPMRQHDSTLDRPISHSATE